jgi:hypothetical protein
MGRLRREGFVVSPSATAQTIANVAAKAMKVPRAKTIDDAAALIRRYLSTTEVNTGYGEVKNWVVYQQPIEMTRALARAQDPYARQPGDGR